MVQIKPELLSVFVDVTPMCIETVVQATSKVALRSVGIEYMIVDTKVNAMPCSLSDMCPDHAKVHPTLPQQHWCPSHPLVYSLSCILKKIYLFILLLE